MKIQIIKNSRKTNLLDSDDVQVQPALGGERGMRLVATSDDGETFTAVTISREEMSKLCQEWVWTNRKMQERNESTGAEQ